MTRGSKRPVGTWKQNYKCDVFRLDLPGGAEAVVHHHIDYGPDQWLVSLHRADTRQELDAATADDAKAEATRNLATYLRAMADALDEVGK